MKDMISLMKSKEIKNGSIDLDQEGLNIESAFSPTNITGGERDLQIIKTNF